MYCPKCGVENADHSTHCVNCGQVLTVPVGQPPVEARTSGLAITAFVLGLLCLTCVLWPILVLPAIICAIIALVRINKSGGRLKGASLAVVGLTIPLVLTLILPIIAAILMPALAKSKDVAQRVVCGTNLKALSNAMIIYANDYDGRYPTPEQWCDLLMQEADISQNCFSCPEDPEGSFSYAVNQNIYAVEPGKASPQMVVLFEADLGKNAAGGPGNLRLRHDGSNPGCNIVFADGHTEFVTQDRIPDLQWIAD